MADDQTVRWLLVFSVLALLLGPATMMLMAFSSSGILIGTTIILMGALGLFAGMRALKDNDGRG